MLLVLVYEIILMLQETKLALEIILRLNIVRNVDTANESGIMIKPQKLAEMNKGQVLLFLEHL
jgi:hypothetical protein